MSKEELSIGKWVVVHNDLTKSQRRLRIESLPFKTEQGWQVKYSADGETILPLSYFLADMGIEPYPDGQWHLVHWTEEIDEPTLENLLKGLEDA